MKLKEKSLLIWKEGNVDGTGISCLGNINQVVCVYVFVCFVFYSLKMTNTLVSSGNMVL